jgi:hypothetical protein
MKSIFLLISFFLCAGIFWLYYLAAKECYAKDAEDKARTKETQFPKDPIR